MAIGSDVVPYRATPKLVARDAMDFSDDIPQGYIDARKSGTSCDVMSVPKMLAKHHLPQVLNASWIFAHDQLCKIFDSSDNASRLPLQRCFTPADEPRLVRDYLYKYPVSHPGVAYKCFYSGDFHALIIYRFLRIVGRANTSCIQCFAAY